jgi:hypothetical protein
MWAILLACKVMAQYHDATNDHAALDALKNCLAMLTRHLKQTPLFNWGRYRWFEGLIPVFHLYERAPQPWLINLANMLHKQGFDWRAYTDTDDDFAVPTPRRGLWKWEKHVVNLAMAVKAGALWSRVSRNEHDRTAAADLIARLDRYHGQVTGVFSGDECAAGTNPVQGTELCAVVEYMYALEQAMAVTGDPALADRLERITFNALPATFSPDMWAHQYDQQANQIQCTINNEKLWTTNGPDSNLYGLEPNFGCCTANMSQGWPKFAAHLWMRTQDGGIAAVAYAPSAVTFHKSGVPVTVTLDTDYPFRDTLTFTVNTTLSERFPLVLRIPAWTKNARVSVNGKATTAPKPGTFHRVERIWQDGDRVVLQLPMAPVVTRRYNHAASIERGPLVYSLQIGEEWKRVNEQVPGRELPHADWEVRPTTPWNYALELDARKPESSVTFEERPMADKPFSPATAPMVARVHGRKLEWWGVRNGWAGDTPVSPVETSEPREVLTLIPYGCTNLRISEFPVAG